MQTSSIAAAVDLLQPTMEQVHAIDHSEARAAAMDTAPDGTALPATTDRGPVLVSSDDDDDNGDDDDDDDDGGGGDHASSSGAAGGSGDGGRAADAAAEHTPEQQKIAFFTGAFPKADPTRIARLVREGKCEMW